MPGADLGVLSQSTQRKTNWFIVHRRAFYIAGDLIPFSPSTQPARVSAIAREVCNAGGGWPLDRSGTPRLRLLPPVCPGPGNGLFV